MAYAAAGTTAADGRGRNSPYTSALLAHLEALLELSSLFRRVRAQVLESTDGQQRPHEYRSLLREHYTERRVRAGAGRRGRRGRRGGGSTVFWQSAAARWMPGGPTSWTGFWTRRGRDSGIERKRGDHMMTKTTRRSLFVAVLAVGLWLAPFAEVGTGALAVLSPAVSDPDDGGTALHWAARLGAMDVVEALVAAGADPGARDADGETALHWMARRNEGGRWLAGADQTAVLGGIDVAGTVAALVRLGADVQARAEGGVTVLHMAARADAPDAVAAFVDAGVRVDAATDDGETALHWAAQADASGAVAALVDAGVRVDAATDDGETALHWAAQADASGVVAALVDAGARVDAAADDGGTALHWAARDGGAEAATALVTAGADVHRGMAGRWNQSPLHTAAYYFSAEVAGVLLAAGADVNARDLDGETPLHWLARGTAERPGADSFEALQTMQVLTANDADAGATTDAGETPMTLGRRLNQERLRVSR